MTQRTLLVGQKEAVPNRDSTKSGVGFSIYRLKWAIMVFTDWDDPAHTFGRSEGGCCLIEIRPKVFFRISYLQTEMGPSWYLQTGMTQRPLLVGQKEAVALLPNRDSTKSGRWDFVFAD